MKLVIDIDEEIYNHMKERFMYGYVNTEIDKVGLAVRNGTPLPKGHGDLIDRQALIDNGIKKGFCDWYDEIKYADTIIEAERGDTE